VAVIANGEIAFARGYGYRNLAQRLAVTPATIYPIASTTKAMTATLIGMLVDDGRLDWDVPVRDYLPRFALCDPVASAHATLRDLLSMRTGLPRHDWMWDGYPTTRAELVERLRYLAPSCGFRERFQYNNILVTTAGYIAEVVMGRTWETLLQERLLGPLGMSNTHFTLPTVGEVTLSYRETRQRELTLTHKLASDVTGPSGGSIHSTVNDMALWALFNLRHGEVAGHFLIQPQTLAQIHAPQTIVGSDPVATSPDAAYAMGWFVDTYNGHARVSHGGYLHDVSSDVALFPAHDLAIVSFTNFGYPLPARLINQQIFALMLGLEPLQSFEGALAKYEKKIADNRERLRSARRIQGTSPSHPLEEYAGVYRHPGYGAVEILRHAEELVFQRHPHDSLILPLCHWHYDVWVAEENDFFGEHEPNPFDAARRLVFESDADGDISVLSIRLEPAVDPIRFHKQRAASP